MIAYTFEGQWQCLSNLDENPPVHSNIKPSINATSDLSKFDRSEVALIEGSILKWFQ